MVSTWPVSLTLIISQTQLMFPLNLTKQIFTDTVVHLLKLDF